MWLALHSHTTSRFSSLLTTPIESSHPQFFCIFDEIAALLFFHHICPVLHNDAPTDPYKPRGPHRGSTIFARGLVRSKHGSLRKSLLQFLGWHNGKASPGNTTTFNEQLVTHSGIFLHSQHSPYLHPIRRHNSTQIRSTNQAV